MSDPGENAQATPSDEESSDSYYKSKFKFKKNSIEIKKKSLLKDKIKKVDIERIIRSDPILSKINRPPETEGEVFCLATGSENSKGQPSSPPDTAAQNAKKPKNSSVVYFKEPTLTHKEINLHDGKDAKTDKREHPNGTDESAPLKNKCLPTSGGMKKSFLSSGKNKNKKKITSGILNDAYSLDGVKSPPGNAPRGHIGKPATKDDETKKKELSPLAIIKKHGRLANQIDEIHTSNGEEIEHLRSEYASIKNDLHKIMSIMNVSRTTSGNLPVYPKIRRHGTIVTTVVRHIYGDVKAFKEHLRTICEAPVREHIGYIEVKGIHTMKIKQWLQHIGF